MGRFRDAGAELGPQSVLEELALSGTTSMREHRLGWARRAPADIVLSRRRLLQPDLFVVPWRPREDREPFRLPLERFLEEVGE
jgi:hypothetical protein